MRAANSPAGQRLVATRYSAKSSRPKGSSSNKTAASTSSVIFGFLNSVGDAPTREQPRQGDQHDRAQYGYQQARQVEAHRDVFMHEQAPQPATDEGAKNTQHDVADDSVGADTHHQARQ